MGAKKTSQEHYNLGMKKRLKENIPAKSTDFKKYMTSRTAKESPLTWDIARLCSFICLEVMTIFSRLVNLSEFC